ncbi:hypothetical protein F1D05_26495 [Kribbella qitaiheensis]|uniref:Uncharacterized protein n=1 Tax=Kribbella qitaiheensis TaxID=1544730 RepID=A0A7G6X3J8_9ACTN|nr:hypothetical protein [Kribbella qitaiheensis]QNE20813.1 hypothetical protein F1D05_26495 [Kribbella qitaiheensis]
MDGVPVGEKEAEALIHGKAAEVRSILVATPTRWSSTWADCSSNPCRYAAVVKRDGKSVAGPVRSQYAGLRVGDEAIAVSGPTGETLTAEDPSWKQTVLLRLTANGTLRTALSYARPGKTFEPDEILTDQVGPSGELRVLNVRDSTLRELQPAGLEGARSPVRDGTGRWWVVTGKSESGSRSDIAWTDNGGRTWNNALLDPDNPAAKISVSQNGRTIVASSWLDGATLEAIGLLRMSTDRVNTGPR